MKQNKIFLTGGHGATTALATAEKLQSYDLSLYWIGSRYAQEGKKALAFEFVTFPKYGIKCLPIRAGRIQRKLTRHSLSSFFKIPFGFWDSLRHILKYRPDLVLSFGGFAAFPVCFWGWVFNIPVIIHEQTTAAGLANRATALFASKVALARQSSAEFFDNSKIVVLGNPVRSVVLNVTPPKKLPKLPVVYITGGSRGSSWINKALRPILPEILKNYKVVHQAGPLDYKKFYALKNKNYEVYKFLDEEQLRKVYQKAHIIIGRAGANTVAEILCLQIPSILIPIPWVQKDEQTENAKLVQKAGFGEILSQDDLSPTTLKNKLQVVRDNWIKMKNRALEHKSNDTEAADKLAKLVLETI